MTEAWPTGTLIADKFRVVRVLGTGGMGVVYEVIHEITRHRRALKTLNAKAREQPTAIERFLREASAAGRIGNPHIAETFDAGVLPTGEPYLVMELLEGETLESRMTRKGRLSQGEIVSIFLQAAEGVQAAHDAGIVHRDLKPENLFLTKTRDGMRVKLLDFGVSIFDERHRLDRSTQDGTILGTPYYMSPEQVRGERQLDGRSDVYALGIMIHECANGVHPYPAETVVAIIANVLEKTPKPLTLLVPDILPSLSALVDRAIIKDPEKRLATARELIEGLGACGRELGGDLEAPFSIAQGRRVSPAESAVSWINAPGSPTLNAGGPISAAHAASVIPPPVASVARASRDDSEAAMVAPKRTPIALSLAGGLVGAAVVAGALYFALARTPAARPTDDGAASMATVRASADVAAPPRPSSSDVSVTPVASAAPSSVPSAAASASDSVASPISPGPSIVNTARPVAKPGNRDLAGKGEFKP